MCKAYLKKVSDYVYVHFSKGKTCTSVSTGVSLPDKYWTNKYVSTKCPQYAQISRQLDICLRTAVGVINILPPNTSPNEVKKKYLEVLREQQSRDNFELGIKIQYNFVKDFEDFMQRRRALYRKNTIKKYRTTLGALLEFESHSDIRLDIDTFDKVVFQQFISFLIFQRNNLNNTIAKHVNVLKAFIRDRYPEFDTSFLKYKEYRPEVIALEEHELMQLSYTPFTGPKEIAKDLFIFLCVTGMRISDARRFNPKWRTDEFIHYSAEKTMSQAYIPLNEFAEGILNKYGGKPPRMCEQYFNRLIKLVCFDCGLDRPVVIRDRQGRNEIETIYPLHDIVSSHTGRKTFISLMLARGVPIQDVMHMSGHQDYRSMKPYIRVHLQNLKRHNDQWKFMHPD